MLRQICNFIPTHVVPTLARAHEADEKARTFTPWSHVVSLMFAHLARAMGLNEVCDSLHLNRGIFSTIRGAVAPNRNSLSHANPERNPAMAQALYWSCWAHSFSRLAAIIRAALWKRWHLGELLACYGTSVGRFRGLGPPEQGLLPGFWQFANVLVGQPNVVFAHP